MTKQPLDDGGWFDLDQAENWVERTYVLGGRVISRATGNAVDHEILYRTESGDWAVYGWSTAGSHCRRVTEDEASTWLLRNRYEVPNDLAEQI